MRHQGRAAWRRFNAAMQAGRVPTREVLDGALVIFGGALLLTPGFITDILGLALLIPPSRAVVRAVLARRIAHRMVAVGDAPRRARTTTWTGTATDVDPDRIERPEGGALSDARRRSRSPIPRRASTASRGLRGAGRTAARSSCCSTAARPVVVRADATVPLETRRRAGASALRRRRPRLRPRVRRRRAAGRARRRRGGGPGRRHRARRAALPRARDGRASAARRARSAASASAATRGATPTGSGSRPRGRWRPGWTTARASC